MSLYQVYFPDTYYQKKFKVDLDKTFNKMNESSQGELTINSSTRQALDPDTKEDELDYDGPEMMIKANTEVDDDFGDKFSYT